MAIRFAFIYRRAEFKCSSADHAHRRRQKRKSQETHTREKIENHREWNDARKKTNDRSCRKRRRRRKAPEIEGEWKRIWISFVVALGAGNWNHRKSRIIVLCKWRCAASLHIVWQDSRRAPIPHVAYVITYHAMLPLNHRARTSWSSASVCLCVRHDHGVPEHRWRPVNACVNGTMREAKANDEESTEDVAQKSNKFSRLKSGIFCAWPLYRIREAFFSRSAMVGGYCCSLRALAVVNLHKKWLFFCVFVAFRLLRCRTEYLKRKWRRDKCEWLARVHKMRVLAYRAHRWMLRQQKKCVTNFVTIVPNGHWALANVCRSSLNWMYSVDRRHTPARWAKQRIHTPGICMDVSCQPDRKLPGRSVSCVFLFHFHWNGDRLHLSHSQHSTSNDYGIRLAF